MWLAHESFVSFWCPAPATVMSVPSLSPAIALHSTLTSSSCCAAFFSAADEKKAREWSWETREPESAKGVRESFMMEINLAQRYKLLKNSFANISSCTHTHRETEKSAREDRDMEKKLKILSDILLPLLAVFLFCCNVYRVRSTSILSYFSPNVFFCVFEVIRVGFLGFLFFCFIIFCPVTSFHSIIIIHFMATSAFFPRDDRVWGTRRPWF